MRPRPVAFSLSIGGVVAAAASGSRSPFARLAFRVRAPSCRSCLPPGSFVAWWQTLTAARWRAVFRSAPYGRSAEDVTPPSTRSFSGLSLALSPPPLLQKRCPLGATPPAGLFVGYRSPVLSGYRLPGSSVVSSLPFLDQRLFGLCLFRATARFITTSACGLRLPIARLTSNGRRVGRPAGPSRRPASATRLLRRASAPRPRGYSEFIALFNITPAAAGVFTFNHYVTTSRARPPRTSFEREPSPAAESLLAYMRVGAGASSPRPAACLAYMVASPPCPQS